MKKLYRARHDKLLGGVAAGIAKYFEVDVVLVRLIWVLVALSGGAGVLAYIIAWIIIPPEPEGETWAHSKQKATNPPPRDVPADEPSTEVDSEVIDVTPVDGTGRSSVADVSQTQKARTSPQAVFGILLVVLGALLLANRLFPFEWEFFWNRLLFRWWPLGIVALGVFIMVRAVKGEGS